MPIQYITNEAGDPKAVVITIDEWNRILDKLYECEPGRNDTEYLLGSGVMKKRLLEARERKGGKTWEEVKEALSL